VRVHKVQGAFIHSGYAPKRQRFFEIEIGKACPGQLSPCDRVCPEVRVRHPMTVSRLTAEVADHQLVPISRQSRR
jgi:hypothetical protein